MELILASKSPIRRALLTRLLVPFTSIAANIDERGYPDESYLDLVVRLSEQKAQAIAKDHPSAWVIGSDQICVCAEHIYTKPQIIENAINQLTFFSGKVVTFYTGLCLYNKNSYQSFIDVIPTIVHFRHLSTTQIRYYVEHEDVLECAGSFKAEGLGISLFEKIENSDPTSLLGLPLIRLCDFLEMAQQTNMIFDKT